MFDGNITAKTTMDTLIPVKISTALGLLVKSLQGI